MRQDYTVAVGADLIGASLPDGSAPAAISVDNHSGYWYQLSPAGDWISPYTTGTVYSVDTIPDLRAMPAGPAGQVSLTTGDALLVTVFDAADAPADSRGNAMSWLTPNTGTLRYLGSLLPNVYPTIAHKTYTLLPTERALWVLLPNSSAASYYADVFQTTGAVPLIGYVSGPGLTRSSWAVLPIQIELSNQWTLGLAQTQNVLSNPAYVFAATQLPIVDLSVGRGQSLMAGSIPVVIAQDQAPITTRPYLATGSTITSIAPSTFDTVILNANAARKFAAVYNGAASSMYLLLANVAASTTNYTVVIPPGGYYELPAYSDVARAVWGSSAGGNAQVTELT